MRRDVLAVLCWLRVLFWITMAVADLGSASELFAKAYDNLYIGIGMSS